MNPGKAAGPYEVCAEKMSAVGNEEERLTKSNLRMVMNLDDKAKMQVNIGSELSEEFVMQVGVHQRSVLSPHHKVDVIMKYT